MSGFRPVPVASGEDRRENHEEAPVCRLAYRDGGDLVSSTSVGSTPRSRSAASPLVTGAGKSGTKLIQTPNFKP